tara:strand:+ start:343 stop:546 length:204 start_codon:yes stop_codon:yes gene_type:complete
MSKTISAEINLSFTTENRNKLPSNHRLKHDISDIFAAALDKYLSDKGVSYNEVHAVLCDDVFIDNDD